MSRKRSKTNAKKHELEPHYPSSPTRPPVAHFYFTIRDADGNTVSFYTHAFGAFYAAAHWFQRIYTDCTDLGYKYNWTHDDTITFTDPTTEYSLTIKDPWLQDVLEQKLTEQEQRWTPPYPDSELLERTINFPNWKRKELSHTATSESDDSELKPKSKPPKPPKRHKSQKAAPQGFITVAQLAAEIDLPPNKARNILRKASISKPEGGWTFKENDPAVAKIRDLLSKG